MSQNSARQNYQAFSEWHVWAKSQYPAFRAKKKKKVTPIWEKYEG